MNTPMTAKQLIEILKAFEQGKTIQMYSRASNVWHDVTHDLNSLLAAIYNDRELRIKPELEEFWLVFDDNNEIVAHYPNFSVAVLHASAYENRRVIHVREVAQ